MIPASTLPAVSAQDGDRVQPNGATEHGGREDITLDLLHHEHESADGERHSGTVADQRNQRGEHAGGVAPTSGMTAPGRSTA